MVELGIGCMLHDVVALSWQTAPPASSSGVIELLEERALAAYSASMPFDVLIPQRSQ
jgi:hypothetical protein